MDNLLGSSLYTKDNLGKSLFSTVITTHKILLYKTKCYTFFSKFSQRIAFVGEGGVFN